jgi:hypothetical protein
LAFLRCFLWPTHFRHVFIVNQLLHIANHKVQVGKNSSANATRPHAVSSPSRKWLTFLSAIFLHSCSARADHCEQRGDPI